MVETQRIPEIVNSIKSNYIKRKVFEPSEEDVETIAAELIDKLEISEHPVPIVSILKSIGFNIYISDMPSPNISGFILIDPTLMELHGTDKIISVSNRDDAARQRFVLVHEFGHFLFDYNESDNKVFFDTYNELKNDEDKEAIRSRFAAEILMPPQLFENEYKKLFDCHYPKIDIVEQLIRNFGVNKKSILKRYVELQLNDSDRVGVYNI